MTDETDSENNNKNECKQDCPVCYEELLTDCLICVNHHKLCYTCVRQLVMPNENTCGKRSCSGYQWKCPVCRCLVCIPRLCMLAVCTGSWAKAVANLKAGCRGCIACSVAWSEGNAKCAECDPHTEEETEMRVAAARVEDSNDSDD